MRSRKLALIFSLTLAAMMLLGVASVYAAPIEKVASTQYSFIGGGMESTGMLRVVLPESTEFPVDVEMAVPKGSSITWFGEIIGDDPANDITATYKLLETRGDYDVYLATVKQSLTVQAEFSGSPLSQNNDAGNAVMTVSYEPVVDTNELLLAAEIPANAAIISQDLQSLGSGISGQVYGNAFGAVSAGEEKSLAIEYRANAVASGGKTGSTGENETLIIVVVLAVVALAVGAIIFAATKRSKASAQVQAKTLKKVNVKSATPTKPAAKSTTTPTDGAKPSAKRTATIITALIVVVGVAALVISALVNTSTSKVGNTYFREFAQGDPCAEAQFALTQRALDDPESSADELFDTMEGASFEILSASLDPDAATLVVKFCESKTNEAKVNELLEPTGYVELQTIPLGQPTAGANGIIDYYFSKTNPCALTVMSIKGDLPKENNEKVTAVATALRSVPSISVLRFDSNTQEFTIGFCNDQANDEVLVEALEKANFKPTIVREMEIIAEQTGEQPAN